jgi:hypothetical protein
VNEEADFKAVGQVYKAGPYAMDRSKHNRPPLNIETGPPGDASLGYGTPLAHLVNCFQSLCGDNALGALANEALTLRVGNFAPKNKELLLIVYIQF